MMQYVDDTNLAARQRLWAISERTPAFDFYTWVLDLVPPGRTLDVGCGNGSYLDATGAIGIDLSIGMLAAARDRSSAPLACADAEAIPFADDAFDVVIAPHMLYHVPDREQAARELRRVTRPGGTCVAVTNSATNHAEMMAMVEDVVGGDWRWRRPSDVSFSMENGEAQLRAGFADIETVWAPPSVVSVTDADAYAGYVASVGDTYQEQVDVPWSDVVDECRRRVVAVIERDGSFPISTSFGAFVCR
jgi:SAM-dependent methyltransferase